MLRTIVFLTPVYVSIFWAILLSVGKKTHSNPRSFLSKYMVLLVLIFIGKFLLYEPLPEIYLYYDFIFLYVGCLAYPIYHIYFRLLTVDEKFSWKAHSKFLILPILLVTIYEVGVFFAPSAEYKVWLFHRTEYLNLPQIRFLSTMREVLKIFVQLQVVYFLVTSTLLLRKYKDRAEQFYSDLQDGKYNNAKVLNYLLIFNGLLIIIPGALFGGNTIALFVVLPFLFAIDIFMIGYMGYRQKPINPTFAVELDAPIVKEFGIQLNAAQKEIHDKLLVEFQKKKLYLNSELNIMEVVQLVGSNRTYISSIINQQYNQNFCAFVNSYRIIELEQFMINNSNNTVYEVLAEKSGFGSVKSMQRAVTSSTGLSIAEWKKTLITQ
jgi:AraC-like DNA-binding protein